MNKRQRKKRDKLLLRIYQCFPFAGSSIIRSGPCRSGQQVCPWCERLIEPDETHGTKRGDEITCTIWGQFYPRPAAQGIITGALE